MNRCAQPDKGASRLLLERRRLRQGFTLLEICTVLFIIMILMGVMMPAMQSAFVEQSVREDAHQLSLMVKTAMLQSSDQHRAYVIDLTSTTMTLHPMEAPKQESDSPSIDENASDKNPATEDATASRQLNPLNKLLAPDPKKANAWKAMPPTSWIFQPGELCPASTIRLTRGNDWIELSFNPLTGNAEENATYFP